MRNKTSRLLNTYIFKEQSAESKQKCRELLIRLLRKDLYRAKCLYLKEQDFSRICCNDYIKTKVLAIRTYVMFGEKKTIDIVSAKSWLRMYKDHRTKANILRGRCYRITETLSTLIKYSKYKQVHMTNKYNFSNVYISAELSDKDKDKLVGLKGYFLNKLLDLDSLTVADKPVELIGYDDFTFTGSDDQSKPIFIPEDKVSITKVN